MSTVPELQAALLQDPKAPARLAGGDRGADQLRALLREAKRASNAVAPLDGFGPIAFDPVDDEFCFLAAE